MIERRLAIGLLLGLGGCGFRPLYGKYGPAGATVRPELAAIYVGVMHERQGQLLRQALQQRFAGSGEDAPAKRFELTGEMAISTEAIGIQQDTSATRIRFNAVSDWKLRRLGLEDTLVTSGVARALDGIDVNNQEYFAVDLETSSAFRRMADTLADKITLDLAVYFRTHPELA